MFPRNIRRIEPWHLVRLVQLLQETQREVTSQKNQDYLYGELASLGVKRKKGAGGVGNSGGFRTYLAQLACLGLYIKHKDGTYTLTNAGEAVQRMNNPLRVLRTQLLRLQFPSVYGLGPNVRIDPRMRVKPFCFLIRLLQDSRLGGFLNEKEFAIPVLYAQSMTDHGACVEKILKLRSFKEDLSRVVLDPQDTYTPRSKDRDLEDGIEDALQIGNTAKNYMMGALLLSVSGDSKASYCLSDSISEEIAPLMADADVIEPLDADHPEAFQERFGRYDKKKILRIEKRGKVDGVSALVQSQYIHEVENNPFTFNEARFRESVALNFGIPVSRIDDAISTVRNRKKNIERDMILKYAYSGGVCSNEFEAALTGVFKELGFEKSLLISHRKPDNREGGYPDVLVETESLPECGLVDAKATPKYTFGIGDTTKLATYYRESQKDFTERPCAFFAYVAGGFGILSKISVKLQGCAEKFGHPVSAVSISALLDLLEMEEKPSPRKILEKLSEGRYFSSAQQFL